MKIIKKFISLIIIIMLLTVITACSNDYPTTGIYITTTAILTTRNTENLPVITDEEASDWLLVVNDEGLAGYFNKEGNMMIPFSYMMGEVFYKGTAIVSVGQTYGLIDVYGNYILAPDFNIIQYTYNDYIMAKDIDNKARLYDLDGNIVNEISGINDYKYLNFEDYFAIKNTSSSLYAIYSLSQGLITDYEFQRVESYSDGLFLVTNINNTRKFLNIYGTVILDNDYTYVTSFKNGFASAFINNEYQFINKSGNQVFGLTSDIAFIYNDEGVSLYSKNDLYGICDILGNIIISAIYEIKDDFFTTNLSSVFIDPSTSDEFLFDKSGEILFQSTDYEIIDFEGDYILLKSKETDEMRVVDIHGNVVTSTLQDSLSFQKDFSGMLYIIYSYTNNYGTTYYSVLNTEGNILISNIAGKYPPSLDYTQQVIIIDNIYDFSGNLVSELPGDSAFLISDLVVVNKDDLWGIYDIQGNEILPIQYTYIYFTEFLTLIYS